MGATAKRLQSRGVLTSTSELEVGNAGDRSSVIGFLKSVLEKLAAPGESQIRHFTIRQGDYADTIELEMQIEGSSFREADLVTRRIVESLKELLRESPAVDGNRKATVEQTSQTLLPA